MYIIETDVAWPCSDKYNKHIMIQVGDLPLQTCIFTYATTTPSQIADEINTQIEGVEAVAVNPGDSQSPLRILSTKQIRIVNDTAGFTWRYK